MKSARHIDNIDIFYDQRNTALHVLSLRVVEVQGSNYEMGYQHGEKCRDKIARFSKNLIDEAVARTGMSTDKVYNVAKEYLPKFDSRAPHLVEEIRGISDGAGLDFEKILLLNLRHEFMFGLRTKQWANCTGVGITPDFSGSGGVIIAQNVDLPASFLDQMVLLHATPKSGPRMLIYSTAGTVGNHGINSKGLARTSNALASSHERTSGVSRVVISRLILEKGDVQEALEVLENVERAVSGNYMLADSNGTLLDVETTADNCRVLHPHNGFVVHTNHILHPDIAESDTGVAPDSLSRYERMSHMVSTHRGKVATEDLKRWFRDHEGYPGSVCNHTALTSIASIICEPSRGVMHLCHGSPCQNEYAEFQV